MHIMEWMMMCGIRVLQTGLGRGDAHARTVTGATKRLPEPEGRGGT
jgi:hypothetical protein